MAKEIIHDLFVTDVEYDADETQLGRVSTTGPTTTITIMDAVTEYEGLKEGSIVRFVSTDAYTVTDYMMVRSLTRNLATLTFTVDAPVTLAAADNYRAYLVREWFPRSLPLISRFKNITAVQVLAFAFTGIDGGNLYEGINGQPQHDYIGLEIKELPGQTRSTNRNMESMLAVLPTKMDSYHPSSWNDARDAMVFVPNNMATVVYENPLPAVSSITPRFVNRRGETIKAARFHLWLRLSALEL